MQPKYVVTLVSKSFLDPERKKIIMNQLMSGEHIHDVLSVTCNTEERSDTVFIAIKQNMIAILTDVCRVMDSMCITYDCHFSNDFKQGSKVYQQLLHQKPIGIRT
ncbi:MAG: hypothetical protein H7Y41_05255 [Hyphomonadaceae bacterium]|nr:hypothetical protein [Clostridia bacterium]